MYSLSSSCKCSCFILTKAVSEWKPRGFCFILKLFVRLSPSLKVFMFLYCVYFYWKTTVFIMIWETQFIQGTVEFSVIYFLKYSRPSGMMRCLQAPINCRIFHETDFWLQLFKLVWNRGGVVYRLNGNIFSFCSIGDFWIHRQIFDTMKCFDFWWSNIIVCCLFKRI